MLNPHSHITSDPAFSHEEVDSTFRKEWRAYLAREKAFVVHVKCETCQREEIGTRLDLGAKGWAIFSDGEGYKHNGWCSVKCYPF